MQVLENADMALVQLIAAFGSADDTREFANAVCLALNLSNFHERESSNYEEGYYIHGEYGKAIVKISLAEGDYPDLPYWIAIRDQSSEDDLIRMIEESIIPSLIANGFRLARLEPFGRLNEIRIDY